MSTIFTSSTIFDPVRDAQELFKTFSEPLIRSKEIAYILCNRSNVQRQAIRESFQMEYEKDLIEFWNNNELNDDFLALAEVLLTPYAEADAKYLYEAMKGLGTNEKALMEVLFNRSFEEILEIKNAFQRMFKKSLDKEIKSETSGDFYKLLLHILTVPRSNDKSVNPNKVMEDASNLYKSGEGRKGTDESVFIDILGSRSFAHLRAVFSSYEKQYGKPFYMAAKKETSGDFQDAILYLISQINSNCEHLTEALLKAMNSKNGKGELNRLIASHCERDLSFALEPFMKLHKKSLGAAMQEKFQDDYGMLLQVLV